MKADSNDTFLSKLFQAHGEQLRYPLPRAMEERLLAPYRNRNRAMSWTLSVAAALCLMVLGFWMGGSLSRSSDDDMLVQELVSGHVRSLMAGHLADVASTDQHTVKPWFEGKLDFSPSVRDLAQQGFPLVGGRLDYLDSRSVAALIFKSNQHVINVYQWPTSTASDSKPRLISRRGYQLFTWRKSGMLYWVISDLNAVELQRFTGLLIETE